MIVAFFEMPLPYQNITIMLPYQNYKFNSFCSLYSDIYVNARCHIGSFSFSNICSYLTPNVREAALTMVYYS